MAATDIFCTGICKASTPIEAATINLKIEDACRRLPQALFRVPNVCMVGCEVTEMDMRIFAKVLVILGVVGTVFPAAAATIDVTVDGRSGPWSHAANPDLVYSADSLAPTVVSGNGLSFATGSEFTIAYLSGYTQTVDFYSKTDGNGYDNIRQYDVSVPAQFASNKETAHLQALIGAFADANGTVVGTPFVIGNLGVFAAPLGATELLLGINDNHYADNLGALTVSVSTISSVPLPASAPMFGAALLALGAVGYGVKRRKATGTV